MAHKAQITLEEGSLFTKGNNPWIDGITYNAKWGESSLIPTRLKIAILEPIDQARYDLDSMAWYKARANSGQWITDGNPIGKVSKAVKSAIKDGYRTWSDAADLQFEFVDNPLRSDVFITLAKYKNGGVDDSGSSITLGSHRGLLIDQVIGEIDVQFGAQLGDIRKLGSNPAPAPTPLVLDLNFDRYRNADSADTSFVETIVHEVGHGIGMSHPHDSGLGSVPSGVFPGIKSGDSYAENGTGLYGLNQNLHNYVLQQKSGQRWIT